MALCKFKTPGYVTASIIVSIAGFLNGYDTGSVGAVTVMSSFEETCGTLTPIMRGFTVSLIMLTGAVPAVFAGQLSERYGYLMVIGAGALTQGTGSLLECVANGLPIFLVGRAFAGLGQGMMLSNSYVCVLSARESTYS